MNLIKTLKSKFESLIDRVDDYRITHVLVTVTGNKINCMESIDLYSDEDRIIVAKCRIGIKTKLVTINANNVEYTIENFEGKTWSQLNGIAFNGETKIEVDDNRMFG